MAHARVGVLEVDFGAVGRIPGLVDALNHTTGAQDQCVLVGCGAVQNVDDLGLAHVFTGECLKIVLAHLKGGLPGVRDLAAIISGGTEVNGCQSFPQRRKRKFRIADDRE
ncbi:hypothetical protein D3C73_1257280 [compost metagenome]